MGQVVEGSKGLGERAAGRLLLSCHELRLSPAPHKHGYLDGKSGFSPDFVKLVLQEDLAGGMREKCLVPPVVTGGEYVGIDGKIFGEYPGFAVEVLEEMQRSRANHACITHSLDKGVRLPVPCGGTNHHFDSLKLRRQRQHLYKSEEIRRSQIRGGYHGLVKFNSEDAGIKVGRILTSPVGPGSFVAFCGGI